MAAITICSDFGTQENKVCHCFHCFPIYLPWSDGTGCHDLSFSNGEFHANFSLSSFTFIKRLFSSSSLSAIRVVSFAYLRLLIFSQQSWFLLMLSPVWNFAWCTLHVSSISRVTIYTALMYSFPNLEHQGACIFLNYDFLQIYAQEWDCWIIWQLCI